MKKFLIVFLFVFSFGENFSVVNPNWSIIDAVGNYEMIYKKEYKKYLEVIKETDKILKLQSPYIQENIYNKVFKSGVWDKMIKNVKNIYQKSKDPVLQKIINYMEDIKKRVKKQEIAIV